MEKEQVALQQRQRHEVFDLERDHRRARDVVWHTHISAEKQGKRERYRTHPTGLTAFWGRVTGVTLLWKKLHKYLDKKRYQSTLEEKERLKEDQDQQLLAL